MTTKPWLAAVLVYCRVRASGRHMSVSADAQLQHGVRAILASGPQHMDASCPATKTPNPKPKLMAQLIAKARHLGELHRLLGLALGIPPGLQ